MAKIIEDAIVIKVSVLVKDNENSDVVVLSNENISALEQVAQELLGESAIVEVVRA